MKFGASRYERGKELIKPVKARTHSLDKVAWHNPLKGNEKALATAEVSLKGLGLFVGMKVRF